MSKIKVIPCSGIGKVFGLMAREAALEVTRLIPEMSETVCLAYLVTGENDAINKVQGCPCITIDGCPALCSAKSVAAAGGIVQAKYRAVDEMKNHRGKNAGTGTALSADGWAITDELAAKVAQQVKAIAQEVQNNG